VGADIGNGGNKGGKEGKFCLEHQIVNNF